MSGAGGRPIVGAGKYPAIDARRKDVLRNKASRDSCEHLLRAQLRTGQHLLAFALAEALGATLNMKPGSVRAASGDTTAVRHD